MSDFPEDLFAQLYRRAPSDKDRERLIAVKASLGLSPRDEMWPIIMTLDHYAAANQAARHTAIKEVRSVLDEIKSIPTAAGPLAAKEARQAVDAMIDSAAEKIAKVAARKTESRADTITRRQLVTATIGGAVLACVIAAAGAAVMYFILQGRGICAEAPGFSSSGDMVCFVDRAG